MSSQERLSSSQQVCRFFLTAKWCKFGKRCRFLHTSTPLAGEETADQSECNIQPSLITEDAVSHIQKVEGKKDVIKIKTRTNEPTTTQHPENSCQFFTKYKRCRFGKKCQFLHIDQTSQDSTSSSAIEHPNEEVQTKMVEESNKLEEHTIKADNINTTSSDGKPKKLALKQTRRLCYYFKRGQCTYGTKCNFKHIDKGGVRKNGNDNDKQLSSESNSSQQQSKNSKNSLKGHHLRVKLSDLECDCDDSNDKQNELELGSLGLRDIEIKQLRKRFPNEALCQTISENQSYRIQFMSTDPDWPFDLKEVEFTVTFPEDYPRFLFTVQVDKDQILPLTINRQVEASINEWLEKRQIDQDRSGLIHLSFRPFLKWLDRSLMDMFTVGLKQMKREMVAKAAGFEFIPASQLKPAAGKQNSSAETEQIAAQVAVPAVFQLSKDSKSDDVKYEPPTGSEVTDNETNKLECPSEEDKMIVTPGRADRQSTPIRRGTEIRLEGLQLLLGAGTLQCTKLQIVLECERCKSHSDIVTVNGRTNIVPCSKCSTHQVITWHSAMMHHFSAVIGYLDLNECKSFDLVLCDCDFLIGCLTCSKEHTIKGLLSGASKDIWCQFCHQKMNVVTDCVRFYSLQPCQANSVSQVTDVHIISTKKLKKQDPVIQLGQPLPANGTCKHYKKSFRWLRFSCCSKCYPCDMCHNENECDHEMKFATRMLCGFCAKEQAYSNGKPCIACNSLVNKGNSSHWEGGKGCRDKVRMSRNDDKKYTSINKTTSRKAQQRLPKKAFN